MELNTTKYKIDIQGMHCQACPNLISIFLEDEGFKDVHADLVSKQAVFESELNKEEAEKILNKIFSEKELDKYSYNNLQIIK